MTVLYNKMCSIFCLTLCCKMYTIFLMTVFCNKTYSWYVLYDDVL